MGRFSVSASFRQLIPSLRSLTTSSRRKTRLGRPSRKGVWISIFVDNVDEVHARCIEQGLDVTWPPTDMPWNVREAHIRHPDGHVFRISQGLGE